MGPRSHLPCGSHRSPYSPSTTGTPPSAAQLTTSPLKRTPRSRLRRTPRGSSLRNASRKVRSHLQTSPTPRPEASNRNSSAHFDGEPTPEPERHLPKSLSLSRWWPVGIADVPSLLGKHFFSVSTAVTYGLWRAPELLCEPDAATCGEEVGPQSWVAWQRVGRCVLTQPKASDMYHPASQPV